MKPSLIVSLHEERKPKPLPPDALVRCVCGELTNEPGLCAKCRDEKYREWKESQ